MLFEIGFEPVILPAQDRKHSDLKSPRAQRLHQPDRHRRFIETRQAFGTQHHIPVTAREELQRRRDGL